MTTDATIHCRDCGALISATASADGRCRNRWLCTVWHNAAGRARWLADYGRTFRAAHGLA